MDNSPTMAIADIRRTIVTFQQAKTKAREAILREIDALRKMLAELGEDHGDTGSNGHSRSTRKKATTKAPAPGRGKKRVRRTAEQLQKEADEIYRVVKQAGAEGIDGASIRRKFPKVGQSITEFVSTYSPDKKLKTKGAARSTTYHAA
jgi:adenylosuccinate lyase